MWFGSRWSLSRRSLLKMSWRIVEVSRRTLYFSFRSLRLSWSVKMG